MGTLENTESLEAKALEEKQKAADQARLEKMKSLNSTLKTGRSQGGTIIGQVFKPQARMMMASFDGGQTDAAEFTFVNTLAEINDGRSNTVPVAALVDSNDGNEYVYIDIPKWEATTDDDQYIDVTDDEVYLVFDDEDEYGALPIAYTTPFPVADDVEFPVRVALPPDRLQRLGQGVHTVRYFVMNNGVQNHNPSLAQSFYIDILPPPPYGAKPKALELPADLPEPGVITREYLDAHPLIDITIPDYAGVWEGDVIQVFDERDSSKIIYEGPIWPEGVGQPERSPGIQIEAAKLLLLGEGDKSLAYRLKDRAGNVGANSVARPLRVQLTPRPANLKAPEVPQSPIDREDARRGVAINIPPYDNSNPDDDIEVSWTANGVTRTLPRFKFSTGTTSVDWAFLADPDPRAKYLAQVSYKVVRGTDSIGPSPINNVPVDLSVVGPVNPEEPGPVNPNLTLLTVNGGAGTSPANTITPDDADKDGNIVFTVYEGAAAGHVVHFFYGTEEVLPPLTLTSEAAGDIFNQPLPWAKIQAQGNGVIKAWYTVYENDTASNYQQSGNTDVTVTANTVKVGSTLEYDYGTIPAAKQNKRPGSAIRDTGILNCATRPWAGVKMKIKFNPGDDVKVGDKLVLNWVFCQDAMGLNEQPSTRFESELEVTSTHLASRQISFTVPYQPRIFGEELPPLKPPRVPNLNEGAIVCYFTVRRGSVDGVSVKFMVRYSTNEGGVACKAWGN